MVTLSDWICIFPSAQAPYVYAFDDLSRADLERHRRRTVTMANLFNEGFEVSAWDGGGLCFWPMKRLRSLLEKVLGDPTVNLESVIPHHS